MILSIVKLSCHQQNLNNPKGNSNSLTTLTGLLLKQMLSNKNEFFEYITSEDPNKMGTSFKTKLNELPSTFIPTKLTKPRDKPPWVNHEILRLIRKRDKLVSKIKKTISNQRKQFYKNEFKSLKSTIQNKIRRAYWK